MNAIAQAAALMFSAQNNQPLQPAPTIRNLPRDMVMSIWKAYNWCIFCLTLTIGKLFLTFYLFEYKNDKKLPFPYLIWIYLILAYEILNLAPNIYFLSKIIIMKKLCLANELQDIEFIDIYYRKFQFFGDQVVMNAEGACNMFKEKFEEQNKAQKTINRLLKWFEFWLLLFGNQLFIFGTFCAWKEAKIAQIIGLQYLIEGNIYILVRVVMLCCVGGFVTILLFFFYFLYEIGLYNNRKRLERIFKLLEPKQFYELEIADFSCSICLWNMTRYQRVIQLKCHNSHVFHDQCLLKWLVLRESCPVCRKSVLSSQ